MTAPRLEGKTALVTGSDSGIGQAIAIAFAGEGARVVVTYLHDADGADQTRRGVEEVGGRATVVQVDISDEDQVATLFEQALGAFGGVDILVNNAGVDASGKDVSELPAGDGAHALQPAGHRRSRPPRGAGAEHPVEAGRRAGGDRPVGAVPRFERRRLRHRLHLHDGRWLDPQPRPGGVAVPVLDSKLGTGVVAGLAGTAVMTAFQRLVEMRALLGMQAQ